MNNSRFYRMAKYELTNTCVQLETETLVLKQRLQRLNSLLQAIISTDDEGNIIVNQNLSNEQRIILNEFLYARREYD